MLLAHACALTVPTARTTQPRVTQPRVTQPLMQAREPFAMKVDLPPRGTAGLKFRPILESSEAVQVKYGLPFGLNVENKDGLAVVTKAGPGGEQEGDILRYCTEWKMGLPGGMASPLATVASFSGAGLGYQVGLFDVAKATSWDDVRGAPLLLRFIPLDASQACLSAWLGWLGSDWLGARLGARPSLVLALTPLARHAGGRGAHLQHRAAHRLRDSHL